MKNEQPFTAYTDSPLGWVEITGDENFISSITLFNKKIPDKTSDTLPLVMEQCIAELKEYFAGGRKTFNFPIKQTGTDFQQKVWEQLLEIPYGTTISYKELALKMGDERLTRAVGSANGKNKLWIVVPCHRVVGLSGSLTGYAGGIECKRWLLQHETVFANHKHLLF